MENAVSISVNYQGTEITLTEPLEYVGNQAFVVNEFRAAVNRAADQVGKMLKAKYGSQFDESAT